MIFHIVHHDAITRKCPAVGFARYAVNSKYKGINQVESIRPYMLDVESSSQWMSDSNVTEEEQRIMLIKYDR